jgi:hypothetical protein
MKKIIILDTGSYPYNDSCFKVDPELGIKRRQCYLWEFHVVDEKKFFLAVIKYGILWRESFFAIT